MKTLQHNQHDTMGWTSRNQSSVWLKKGILFLTMILLGSLISMANYPPQKLSILGVNGITIHLLVKPDTAPEALPAEIARLFPCERAARMNQLIYGQFDLSTMTKPEQEADDMVIDTHKVFLDIMEENKAQGK